LPSIGNVVTFVGMSSFPHPWKYGPEAYAARRGGCADCGLPYASPAWADVVVPDDVWEQINPAPWKGGGTLCFNCICGRLAHLELKNVPFQIASGPFCFSVR